MNVIIIIIIKMINSWLKRKKTLSIIPSWMNFKTQKHQLKQTTYAANQLWGAKIKTTNQITQRQWHCVILRWNENCSLSLSLSCPIYVSTIFAFRLAIIHSLTSLLSICLCLCFANTQQLRLAGDHHARKGQVIWESSPSVLARMWEEWRRLRWRRRD